MTIEQVGAPIIPPCPDPLTLGVPRDPKWEHESKLYLKEYPACEICGRREGVVVHHKVPVHVDRSLEMKEDNWKVLCPPCHYYTGHFCHWEWWNPDVDRDGFFLKDKFTKAKNRYNALLVVKQVMDQILLEDKEM